MYSMHMKIPFVLNRMSDSSLVQQLADAIRSAISCGDYHPGEILPTRAEFAEALGVSERVPREAIAMLSSEGIVYTRRCLGSVVSEQKARRWNGKILYVESHGLASYYYSALSAAFRQRLTEEGYLVSTVMCPKNAQGKTDLHPLEEALRQKWTFVVLPFASRPIAKAIESSGTDYLVAGRGEFRGAHCVEVFVVEHEKALADLAKACAAKGVRTICQITLAGEDPFLDLQPYGKARGLVVVSRPIRPARPISSLEQISLSAMRAIRRWVSKSGERLPDMIFFTDDYLAAGGLVALLDAGIRVPEDIRVATLTNRGNCPPFPVSLARIENDPVENGISLAARVLKHLKRKTGRLPVASFRFMDGESLGCDLSKPVTAGSAKKCRRRQ